MKDKYQVVPPGALPQKYVQLRGYGFAVGCEAAALPRRIGVPLDFGLCPRTENQGQSPKQGA